ncbi:unnamed protein product [Calypogeia fissa]
MQSRSSSSRYVDSSNVTWSHSFPDEQTGQIPVAFVVRRSTSLSEDDVMSFVAKQVASYKKACMLGSPQEI